MDTERSASDVFTLSHKVFLLPADSFLSRTCGYVYTSTENKVCSASVAVYTPQKVIVTHRDYRMPCYSTKGVVAGQQTILECRPSAHGSGSKQVLSFIIEYNKLDSG